MTTDVIGSNDAASRAPRDIRVLIADDEALVRAGFTVLVNSAPGITVVGEASDGVQAVRQARALQPDVVLMDIRMPVMGGLEATKIILDEGVQEPPPRILVVTTFDEDEHVFAAFARSRTPPPSRRRTRSRSSPSGSSMSSSRWRPGSPTLRSRTPSTCQLRRSRPTSADCSTNWAAATARSSSWSPTRPAPSPLPVSER